MTRPDYYRLNDELLKWIPELEPEYEEERAWWGEEPSPHITYGLLNKRLEKLLSPYEVDRDVAQLRRIFGLLEDLTAITDEDVRGVLTATVCWYLTGRPELYERAKPLMGPRTRELCRTTEP